jgi:DnaJ-class molecular chaperone
VWTTCPLCKGSGKNPLVLYDDDCPQCDGEGGAAGEVEEDWEDVDVKDED